MPYPKRIIEVDLPIKRISAHARREKSIRQGHIMTLHIWWARRPLAACRAILCASLWPDPADKNCPEDFIAFAKKEMIRWSDNDHLPFLGPESVEHFIKVNHDNNAVNNKSFLRQLLLDFIADFANWDNSHNVEFVKTASALTKTAHIALGGEAETNPMVVDPFAGGGSIPLEALRVGADVFASDLNPIPILLNKVTLEFIPKYGKKLSEEILKWGEWIKQKAEVELSTFYPKDKNSIVPIAYLWARTIKCEGPNCGAKVPLLRSLWLAKRGKKSTLLRLIPNKKERLIEFEIIKESKTNDIHNGTVQRGNVTCPCCGFTTPVSSVRKQMKEKNGGTNDAILLAVRKTNVASGEREFLLPESSEFVAIENARKELQKRISINKNTLSLIPDENLPANPGDKDTTLGFRVQGYGINKWGNLFSTRQLLSLTTFVDLIHKASEQIRKVHDKQFADAIQLCLSLSLNRLADFNTSFCVLNAVGGRGVVHTFGRQAISMVWDYMETNPFNDVGANWMGGIETFKATIENEAIIHNAGTINMSSAIAHPLLDDSVAVFFTDPPYYDSVPYSDLSDFFYVWLKRSVGEIYPMYFKENLTNKNEECIVDAMKGKDKEFFERTMGLAMAEGRRITKPSGIGIVVFAHKTTAGWEAQLQAMLNAGWIITGSWPIDTERPGRLRSQNSAALASSVHLVCRPRENADGSLIENQIGDWRDVQEELPKRIHEWMPRLAAEGVVGADAIFACLGPALEVFSRYTKVVQAGSEREISLREYLEKVWAAVSQEALNMVFSGGEAKSLEEDARLTAMWLWTLNAGVNENGKDTDDDDDDDEESSGGGKVSGYTLEYDTARKIAQGLGANLEDLKTLIEVKGDKARLLPVQERVNKLFGATGMQQQPIKKQKKAQLSLSFENVEPEEESKYQMPELKVEQTGKTVLDRLHQAMLLFSTGRTEALKRFLVEDGAGKDDRFWKLAQSLTALYPKDTDERRWVEAVQTYKKGLGF